MSEKVEWYHDFIDNDYEPDKSDIIVLFYFEPGSGVTTEDVVGRLASESSVGTWSTLDTLDDRIYNIRARAFWFNENYVKIAYPLILWETSNIPQLLSGIAGNIFGMKAVKNLRLIDAYLPDQFIKDNAGPNMGIESIQEIMKKKEGPLTATVPKPKIGMTVYQHCKVAQDAWSGGIDIIKDDENLTNQSFNRFKDRVEKMSKIREKVETETGNIKEAFINVTAETKEMEKRVKLLHDNSFRYFMIDVVTCGFSAVQTMRDTARDYNMAIHAHRAMHAAFTKHNTHGISMYFLAKLLRLIGVDNLHIGTVVGKLDSPKQDVIAMRDLLLQKEINENGFLHLPQKWGTLKPVVPVASGGLHPGTLPDVLKIYNTTDMAVQIGGGVHGHPEGTYGGAKACIQAIDAFKEGLTLEEKAKTSPELKKSLEKFGHMRPV
ncbi:MAG: type III ribulose-bisphosphate carboxylase [Candidatus Thorarchaeota archaeon]